MQHEKPEVLAQRKRLREQIVSGIDLPDPRSATREDVNAACAHIELELHRYNFSVRDRLKSINEIQARYEPIFDRRRAAEAAAIKARMGQSNGRRGGAK